VELIARPPVHELLLVCNVDSQQHAEVGGLLQRGEVPIDVEFVRGKPQDRRPRQGEEAGKKWVRLEGLDQVGRRKRLMPHSF
jgi:hypothetical protein